jgi:hypothetical protein
MKAPRSLPILCYSIFLLLHLAKASTILTFPFAVKSVKQCTQFVKNSSTKNQKVSDSFCQNINLYKRVHTFHVNIYTLMFITLSDMVYVIFNPLEAMFLK